MRTPHHSQFVKEILRQLHTEIMKESRNDSHH